MHYKWLSTALVLMQLAVHAPALAWAERGHDLITRAALRHWLSSASEAERPQLAPLLHKEHLLSHLANIPDIMWRSGDPHNIEQNRTTHYYDLEYGGVDYRLNAMPQSTAALNQRLAELCQKPPPGYLCPTAENHGQTERATLVGTAPWRIAQLYQGIVSEWQRAKSLPSGSKEQVAAIDQGLVYAGILSHFVGDLAQPYHTTRDYDGYETGQGGVHAYFESEIVAALDLGLDQELMLALAQTDPLAKLIDLAGNAREQATAKSAPLQLAFLQVIEGHRALSRLAKLDRDLAVTKPSSLAKGMKIPAERKNPALVAGGFRAIVIERLALGSAVLAQLWRLAWREAGQPDFSRYKSYYYPLTPAFIAPNYLNAKN